MSAYRLVQTGVCRDPLLASIEVAIILTMEGSTRAIDPKLSGLCARTYTQYNAGFRTGLKPCWVTKTCTDLTHAYMNACEFAAREGHVLILEDDAFVLDSASRADFAAVDEGIEALRPRVYSLGSFGIVVPARTHQRFLPGLLSSLQAAVWSPEARAKLLLARDCPDFEHIDCGFVAHLGRVYTYRDPLVVQRLSPATDNSKSWCFLCDDSAVDAGLVRAWKRLLEGLAFDSSDRAWSVVYAAQRLLPGGAVAALVSWAALHGASRLLVA